MSAPSVSHPSTPRNPTTADPSRNNVHFPLLVTRRALEELFTQTQNLTGAVMPSMDALWDPGEGTAQMGLPISGGMPPDIPK